MSNDSIGRNAPCPCGSGKKYKHCCMNNADGAANPPHISGVLPEDMKKYIESHPFANIHELRTHLGQRAQASNETTLDDFDGLMPSQMHALLNYKAGDETLVQFPLAPVGNISAPILDIFLAIATIVDRQPCKATAKGKLPRSLCREAAMNVLGEHEFKEMTRFGGINMEEDYPDLHTTRIVAVNSGLLCSDGKKFSLSTECRMLMETKNNAGIYRKLLASYSLGYNWGHRDRHPDFHIIQRSFLYSLYLLQRYGAQKRESKFYEEAFLRAFPAVLKEAPSKYY